MKFSSFLHRNAITLYKLYSSIKAAQVDYKIKAEDNHYKYLAPHPAPCPARDRIKARLTSRNLNPTVKPLADIHILYASRPSNWEPHNIPPEIKKICKLSTYYYSQRGFDDQAQDWLKKRNKLDEDIVTFVTDLHAKKPIDLLLSYLSGWQISPEAIKKINKLGIVTCGFHLDDKLSFRGIYSGARWSGPAAVASAYDLNLTNAPSSIAKYEAEGGIAYFWPEGANPEHYRPLDLPYLYDVSFVGACYGYRPILINYLRRHGISVEAFGPGWPNGPLHENDMVKLYTQSRINLGFGGIGYSTKSQCLKGRDFEVPMSGAAYLTSYNEELNLVYDLDREIITYRTKEDCKHQIEHLLKDEALLNEIKVNARNRCTRDHSWAQRITQLLHIVNLLGST